MNTFDAEYNSAQPSRIRQTFLRSAESEMKNLTRGDAKAITEKVNQLLRVAYKGKFAKSRKIEFDRIGINEPSQKIRWVEVRYLKNIRQILSAIFANIGRTPFTDPRANPYAFEVLWILLSILDLSEERKTVMRKKPVYFDPSRISALANKIRYGKYIFTIPRYKKFVFTVEGYNLAKLKII